MPLMYPFIGGWGSHDKVDIATKLPLSLSYDENIAETFQWDEKIRITSLVWTWRDALDDPSVEIKRRFGGRVLAWFKKALATRGWVNAPVDIGIRSYRVSEAKHYLMMPIKGDKIVEADSHKMKLLLHQAKDNEEFDEAMDKILKNPVYKF